MKVETIEPSKVIYAEKTFDSNGKYSGFRMRIKMEQRIITFEAEDYPEGEKRNAFLAALV